MELRIAGKIVSIDSEDYEKVKQYPWYINNFGYAVCTKKVGKGSKGRLSWSILMHRLIKEPNAGEEIDHVDGNKLNNTKANLRSVPHWINMHNRATQTNNTSGFRGVSWSKVQCAWHAYIWINKKRIHLGYHADIKEAAKAYNEAAIKHLGSLAITNQLPVSSI